MTTKIAFLGSHSTAQNIVTWNLEDFRTKYRLVTARALTTNHQIVGYLRVFSVGIHISHILKSYEKKQTGYASMPKYVVTKAMKTT